MSLIYPSHHASLHALLFSKLIWITIKNNISASKGRLETGKKNWKTETKTNEEMDVIIFVSLTSLWTAMSVCLFNQKNPFFCLIAHIFRCFYLTVGWAWRLRRGPPSCGSRRWWRRTKGCTPATTSSSPPSHSLSKVYTCPPPHIGSFMSSRRG